MNKPLIYTMFAVIATIANIASQDLTTRVYTGPYDLFVAIIVGTGVGLVIKYYLDKKYIFDFQTKNIKDDGKTFGLYSLMGLVTTFIFWGMEFTFDAIFQTKAMRYTGGVIGLAIGYYIKYQLDKRYVFVTKEA
ncbi:GtrA family protein [Catenovulum sp. SM1970]|uniref:GtrA family protein n=1 Tax=Marinifaba aquimaris TaxID=2741323 RepID=UPI001574A998|nr:GtrA family protein [Marinifaba aquimaris]NTS75940.1 GtrA family protein [Marinifaba aquimaris]